MDPNVLAYTSYADTSEEPLATALGVQTSSLFMTKQSKGWCVYTTIKRLLATRRTELRISKTGSLSVVKSCQEPLPTARESPASNSWLIYHHHATPRRGVTGKQRREAIVDEG